MKSKRSLMMVLVGLAMLATPIAAAAKDHGRYDNSHAARVSRSFNAPARNFTPAVANRSIPISRMPAPAAVTRRELRHEWRGANAYRNYGYGNRGYYPAPVYTAPVYAAPGYQGYGSGYGGGQNCRRAQSIVNNYYRDRSTGHPAAAYDLLRQNRWAFNSGCVSGAPMGGGLLGGLGGLGGVPAYNNYGGNYGGYGGYNGGYGQPYGGTSMLAPLLQYIR